MSGYEFHLGMGPYEPDDEPEGDDVPDFLREPDQIRDLEGWACEVTADEGPVIFEKGHCTNCNLEAMFGVRLWRSSPRRGRFPVWTIDGAQCPACGAPGALRARLVGPERLG